MTDSAAGKIALGSTGEAVRLNVKMLREEQGLSFAELSRRTKINEKGLRRIELGERRVDVDDLDALSEALQCSPLFLMGMGDYHPPGTVGTVIQPFTFKPPEPSLTAGVDERHPHDLESPPATMEDLHNLNERLAKVEQLVTRLMQTSGSETEG